VTDCVFSNPAALHFKASNPFRAVAVWIGAMEKAQYSARDESNGRIG
jgi:hypothetical protein